MVNRAHLLRRCGSVALAWLLTGAGCAGNGPAPSSTGSAFDAIQAGILNTHCLSAGCHNGTDRSNNLVLEPGQAYANLVSVQPFNMVAAASGLLRVDPGKPDNSFILIKLQGPGQGEGSRMPLGQPPLSQADIDEIRAWIQDGAPGPGGTSPTPTASPTITLSPASTASPSVTATGSRPPTPTPTQTPTQTSTPSPIATPTFSVESTFPHIQDTIFTVTCLDVGCHNGNDQAAGQVLEPGQAYANLVGVVPQNPTAAAEGFLRVDPGKPENSFLITKLTLPTASDPLLGSRMPRNKTPLSDTQIEAIRAWILRGALPNE